jgi:hypothetical protein
MRAGRVVLGAATVGLIGIGLHYHGEQAATNTAPAIYDSRLPSASPTDTAAYQRAQYATAYASLVATPEATVELPVTIPSAVHLQAAKQFISTVLQERLAYQIVVAADDGPEATSYQPLLEAITTPQLANEAAGGVAYALTAEGMQDLVAPDQVSNQLASTAFTNAESVAAGNLGVLDKIQAQIQSATSGGAIVANSDLFNEVSALASNDSTAADGELVALGQQQIDSLNQLATLAGHPPQTTAYPGP